MYNDPSGSTGWICDSCNMGTSDLSDAYAQSPRATGLRLRAYISGKSRVPMLQLICNTLSASCAQAKSYIELQ